MFIALLLLLAMAAKSGASTPPDLVVVSVQALGHSALLVQPGSDFPLSANGLKDVSEVVLKLFNVDGINGQLFGRRLPRALLTVIVGGLAPEMLNIADFPNLSAILDASPKAVISGIPEPRNFDNMVTTAFSTKASTLSGYLQKAFQNRAKTATLSFSEFVCNLFLGCEKKTANIQDLVSAIDGKLENQILSFSGNNGQIFQLDTSDKTINAFLQEISMILAASFPSSDSSAPTIITVAISTLQPVLNENGIQSNVASACFQILDVTIPEFLGSFRIAFSERAEVAILLLPPSHDAYVTEEIRQIISSINGEASPQSAFIYLSDRSSNGIATAQKQLSVRLPINFRILSIGEESSAEVDANPALYQITLWVSIMLVVLVIISTGALCCGETRKDTLLYSKITPSNDKKTR